jgi:hypothetical protein
MRGRAALVVIGFLAALAPGASAGPACTVLTDAAMDVTLNGQAPVADGHLDLDTVSVKRRGSVLTFTISDAQLDPARQGEWRLTFRSGASRLLVGAGHGMWVNAGNYEGMFGFRAGMQGHRLSAVQGTFDYARSEIRVSVPFAALGIAPGARLTSFAAEAKEVFLHTGTGVAGQDVQLVDRASSQKAYDTAAGC